MLEHLRQHAIELLTPPQVVTLSTCGPAGVQAQLLPSAAMNLLLYVLVPTTSELLFNLEQEPLVVATTGEWQLRGRARALPVAEGQPARALFSSSGATRNGDYTIIEVTPVRLQIGRPNGLGFSETIDFDDTPVPVL